MKCAPDRWYSIGHEIGFKDGKIGAITAGICDPVGKLQKIANVKADEVGGQETAQILLEACEKIPNPVIGAVRAELQL